MQNPVPVDRSLGLLEAQYFANKMFWERQLHPQSCPFTQRYSWRQLFHGRCDVDCRPSGAWRLSPGFGLMLVQIVEEAGHSPQDAPL